MDKWLYPEDLGIDLVINLFTHELDDEVYMDIYALPPNWKKIVTQNRGKDGKPSIHDIMVAKEGK